MRAIRSALAVLAWAVIFVPTTLFVVLVMVKASWATERGKISRLASLVALLALTLRLRAGLRKRRIVA